jgi:protoheme IX farnesyltransferase
MWQFPHFMAIARIYREDYARAGYLVLPARNVMKWVTLASSSALLLVSLAAVAAYSRDTYAYVAAATLGSGLFYYAKRLAFLHSRIAARQLLRATIYLPLQFLLLAVTRG